MTMIITNKHRLLAASLQLYGPKAVKFGENNAYIECVRVQLYCSMPYC